MESCLSDLRHSLRILRQSPSFTIAAVAALAVGIAANTAIFTVVNTVILRPLPFADSDRIVSIARAGGTAAAIPMFTMRSESAKGKGRRITVLTTVKIAVFAAMPMASAATAVIVKLGLCRKMRSECRRSLKQDSIPRGSLFAV